ADPVRLTSSRIPFSYESFAFGPATCNPSPTDGFTETVSGFYDKLFRIFPRECKERHNLARDGDAALAYEATNVFPWAVTYLDDQATPIHPSALAVWRDLPTTNGKNSLDALSGRIDFGGTTTPQVPKDKPIRIVEVDGGIPQPRGFCGVLPGGDG